MQIPLPSINRPRSKPSQILFSHLPPSLSWATMLMNMSDSIDGLTHATLRAYLFSCILTHLQIQMQAVRNQACLVSCRSVSHHNSNYKSGSNAAFQPAVNMTAGQEQCLMKWVWPLTSIKLLIPLPSLSWRTWSKYLLMLSRALIGHRPLQQHSLTLRMTASAIQFATSAPIRHPSVWINHPRDLIDQFSAPFLHHNNPISQSGNHNQLLWQFFPMPRTLIGH